MRLDKERLQDILEAIENMERHLPATWEAFDGDELVRVWCLRHLEIIGEAAARPTHRLCTITSWQEVSTMLRPALRPTVADVRRGSEDPMGHHLVVSGSK